MTLAGCGRSDTGVDIHARLGSLTYDELQFRVTRAGGEVVVDPSTAGRYQGPFQPGDQDVIVYLRDDLDGSQLHCEASALRGGAVVGSGAGDVTVVRGEMKDVEIVMAAPGMPGKPDDGMPAKPDGGGEPGKANGEACSLGAECATGFCAGGFCCESDCRSACHSCGLPDSPGLCRPVAAGTVCAEAGCADDGKSAVPAGSCDGAGKCAMPPKVRCERDTICVAGVCSGTQSQPP